MSKGDVTWCGTCRVCGKRSYPTRKAAKRERRDHLPNDLMRTYQCETGYWHYGHLPWWWGKQDVPERPPTPATALQAMQRVAAACQRKDPA